VITNSYKSATSSAMHEEIIAIHQLKKKKRN